MNVELFYKSINDEEKKELVALVNKEFETGDINVELLQEDCLLRIREQIDRVFGNKTFVAEFISNNQSMSGRLRNVLQDWHAKGNDKEMWGFYRYPKTRFVEDLTERTFLKMPKAGKLTWEEFSSLRGY